MQFPESDPTSPRTGLEFETPDAGLPVISWAGQLGAGSSSTPYGLGLRLLGEHAHGLYTRPHLRGHRLDDNGPGQAWSTWFRTISLEAGPERLHLTAEDPVAGLGLECELESVSGGALRGRYTLTNLAPGSYLLEGLEVVLPAPDHLTELLDFTGRHERERTPQRHGVTDGLWLRESREGRPGLGGATMVVLGTPGFSTTSGTVFGCHVAWSGNAVLRVERDPATPTTLGGGELLQPGEVVLARGESYRTPWVFFAAADDGLDGLAAVWHDYQRSLPTHPATQPVVLNVWEAVYFDHDLDRLRALAGRAARVGVERFVLDDGWFRRRRDDTAGLGDWHVDDDVWPNGLTPLVEQVRSLGMQFGIWVEPEMVNPDSDLYREHPDWVLSAGNRTPLLHRNQLVLDLTRAEAFDQVLAQLDTLLTTYAIDSVKWDHNRGLLEAGSGHRQGAAAVHEQTQAFYRLLDTLRERHPTVDWESCASGGGRIDLGVLERVQRVWVSDMTDALARQQLQRWTVQLVAPEYAGAHVASPTSHTTGRTFDLDFRAATALFGAFGIEWDLAAASEEDLARLAAWVARHQRLRPLLHTGRVVRPESSDPAVLLHGIIAADRSEALVAHVQLDESAHNRGVAVRVPGLDPAAAYALRWEGPVEHRHVSMSAALPEPGPTDGVQVSGQSLATHGFWMPRRRPETVTLVHLTQG